MASSTQPHANETGAMERLMEAERAWREQLDTARAEAAHLLATARAESLLEDTRFEEQLPSLVEVRRRELMRQIDEESKQLRDELLRRADRYRTLDDAALHRLALRLAARVPWLSRVSAGTEVVT